MIEKFKAVNNPLTIIALFAGLAEIAFTTSLALVEKDLQNIFIWFVMIFPTLLIVLFFLTLNFNPKVLYSPSDYKDEENFVNVIIGSKTMITSLGQFTEKLEEAQKLLFQQSEDQKKVVSKREQEKIQQAFDEEFDKLKTQLENLRIESEVVATDYSNMKFPQSQIQIKILQFLSDNQSPQTLEQISKFLGIECDATSRALYRLFSRGLISRENTKSGLMYRIDNLQK